MEYGLIGHPLGHSFSKEIHESIADYEYEIHDLPPEEFESFVKSKNFKAINVTIPYKQKIMPYLDIIDSTAEKIGAVNTVINRNGKLEGYNTDYYGLRDLILRNAGDLKGKRVLILGSGGTSKTAAFTVGMMGAEKIYKATRNEKLAEDSETYITYDKLSAVSKEIDVIINTTPVGMYPQNYAQPVKIEDFPNAGCVIDVVYNPLRTMLVSSGLKSGLKCEGGLYMLVSQAVYASSLFTGKDLSEDVKEKAFKSVLSRRENIVLTGMPGSGKTSVGEVISEITGKKLVDTDKIIAERYGEPGDIIREKGEAAFRDIETEVIKEAAKECGCCIATGGGAILRDDNITSLKLNGIVVFIDRDIDEIVPTDDRPLSSTRELLKKRYEERYARYLGTSDICVRAKNSPRCTAECILEET